MAKWLKRIGWTLGVIATLVVIAFLALRTPDTDRAAMVAKYSAPGDRFIIIADGARVHVRDNGGSGQPMILLHGSNSSLHTWEPLKRVLGDQYRIITLDLPGHGLTGATPTHRYDPDEMVAAVDGVASALGINRFILGGNSMGGGISWRYALAHPAKVEALILIDAAGIPPRSDEKPPQSNIGFRILRSPVGRWLGGQITPRFMIERSLRGSVSNQSVVTEEAIDRYWELLRFPGNREATVIRFARGFADPAAAERMRSITAPTLVIFGREDRIINPSAAQGFAERIRGSRVVMMDGIGHLPMEEAPQATADAISRFLADPAS